ncbi:MAG: phosphoribosylanthranilate isomerase [Desulfatibacillaceae bacterium]
MVQVKICGITTPAQARQCVDAGASAVGLVFHPKSPRFVTIEEARKIRASVPGDVALVGVFADEVYEGVMGRVRGCGLDVVQLHGHEAPGVIAMLAEVGKPVVKALFQNRPPLFDETGYEGARAYLAECAGDALPGGNGLSWDWSRALPLKEKKPLVLAGGLDPENVAEAIAGAGPDAVDVSSGVERAPGDKDIDKVRRFLAAVRNAPEAGTARRVF